MEDRPRKGPITRLKQWVFRPCLHCVLWVFTIILALLLSVQGTIAFMMFTAGHISLPAEIVNWVEKQAVKGNPGLVVSIDRMSFTSKGRIHAENIEILPLGQTDALLSVQTAEATIDLYGLFFGQVRLQKLYIDRGTLYCPAIFSPSGLREPVVEDLKVVTRLRRNTLDLVLVRFNALGIPVTASGSWALPLLPGMGQVGQPQTNRPTPMASPASPLLAAGVAMRQALAFKNRLQWASDPSINIRFSQETGGPPEVQLRAFLESLNIPNIGTAQELFAEAQLVWNQGWQMPAPIIFRAGEVHTDPWGTVRHLVVSSRLPASGGFSGRDWIPDQVFIEAGKVESPHAHAANLSAVVEAGSYPMVKVQAEGMVEGVPTHLRAHLNLTSGRGTVDATLQKLSQAAITPAAERFNFSLPESLQGLNGVHAQAKVFLGDRFKPSFGRLYTRTGPFSIEGKSVQDARLDITYDFNTSQFWLRRYEAEFEGSQLEGAASLNLNTRDLQVWVKGKDLLPTNLDPFMPGWWDAIWPDFEFNGRLPEADFYIRDRLGWRHKINFFGLAKVWDFTFRGLPVDKATSIIYGQPSITEMIEVEALRPEGKTDVTLSWIFWHNKRGLKFTAWDVQSEFPPHLGKSIFNEDIQKVFDDFKPRGRTFISSNGRIYSRKTAADLKAGDFSQIDGISFDPLTYKNYPMETLTFSARVQPGVTAIHVPQGSFALGAIEGDLYVSGPSGEKTLDIDLSLKGARKNELIAALNQGMETPLSTEPPDPDASNPFFNIDLQASGPLGNIFGFTGNGHLEIQDQNLAQVGFFGPLSRAFQGAGLSLGTIRLQRLSSSLQLDRDRVYFPDMTVTGPIATVDMKGNFHLPTTELDFDVQVFAGNREREDITQVVTSIFSPFSYALDIDLVGTIAEPAWNFDLSPVNLFTSDDTDSVSSSDVDTIHLEASQVSLSTLYGLPTVASGQPASQTDPYIADVPFPPEPL